VPAKDQAAAANLDHRDCCSSTLHSSFDPVRAGPGRFFANERCASIAEWPRAISWLNAEPVLAARTFVHAAVEGRAGESEPPHLHSSAYCPGKGQSAHAHLERIRIVHPPVAPPW
jgi:hypothetical protein